MFLVCVVLCLRKRPVDVAVAEYDAAICNIFQVLMNISQQFLTRSGMQPSSIDESEYEFATCVCETVVALGSSNMQCILADGARTFQFLKQVSISKYTSHTFWKVNNCLYYCTASSLICSRASWHQGIQKKHLWGCWNFVKDCLFLFVSMWFQN